jgi:hypothetical protein
MDDILDNVTCATRCDMVMHNDRMAINAFWAVTSQTPHDFHTTKYIIRGVTY